MAIKVNRSTFARWPTKFRITGDDGKIVEQKAIVHFRIGPLSEASIRNSVVGWDDGAFEDEDGPINYSPENLDRLMDSPEIAVGFMEGWRAIINGEHLRGNSAS